MASKSEVWSYATAPIKFDWVHAIAHAVRIQFMLAAGEYVADIT